MLVLHSSSRCDVCLLEYTWETSAKVPHAIACGHIFCRDCLYATHPPLCPLCRQQYQPAKIKKLHVDKPENIDDHREVDLLQRLAVSWDVPDNQLEELRIEVDTWLRGRSDDTCIALRKSRAALTRHRELKDAEASYEDIVNRLEEDRRQLDNSIIFEQNKSRVAAEAYMAKIDSLTKQNVYLKAELETIQTATQRYLQPRNPLPPPPEPISTEHIPTLAQVVSESGVRFSEFPSPSAKYPFEIESRSSKKGKARSTEARYGYAENSRYQEQSPQQAASPSSRYVQPHVAQQPTTYSQTPNHSTRSSGLQMHFENTTQPLDAFTLTSAYLREYSTGFVNGQELANGRRITEVSETYPMRQPHASTSHYASQPISAVEPTPERYRESAANTYQSQPYSPPADERSPRPHRRQETAASIISSMSSNGPDNESSSRSRSRSHPRSRVASIPSSQDRQINNPMLASILSSNPVRPPSRRQSTAPSLLSPQISRTGSQNASDLLSYPQQPIPPTTAPSNPPPAANPRRSPSNRSLQTVDTWGTQTPSHLASGSLIRGLRSFRIGVEPVLVGGQPEITTFHELASDGASIRTRETRETSFSDQTSESVPVAPSPVRPIHSMVGVLPVEETDSSPRLERMASYRSPTSVDTRHRQGGWDDGRYSTLLGTGAGAGYQSANDRSQQQAYTSPSNQHPSNYREERATSHRSRTSMDTHSSYESNWQWESGDYAHPQDPAASVAPGSRSNGGRYQGSMPPPPSVSSSDRYAGRSHRSGRHRSNNHRPLPSSESPFPITVESTDDERSYASRNGSDLHLGAGQPELQSFENALGLQLTTGPTQISAPTPVLSTQRFLRSWSREHYES